jgi:hypothetical protein
MAAGVEKMSKIALLMAFFTDFCGSFYILNDESAEPYISTLCI